MAAAAGANDDDNVMMKGWYCFIRRYRRVQFVSVSERWSMHRHRQRLHVFMSHRIHWRRLPARSHTA